MWAVVVMVIVMLVVAEVVVDFLGQSDQAGKRPSYEYVILATSMKIEQ